MVVKAQNEGIGSAGWQLACLLACGAASFDIGLTDHATSAHVEDQPPLLRLLTVVDDLSGFLRKLRRHIAGRTKTNGEQLQLRDLKVHPGRLRNAVELFDNTQRPLPAFARPHERFESGDTFDRAISREFS